MDRLRAMEIFVRVVDAGNFTRAAETLSLPKATVSTAVRQLEDHLGVRLLHRTTRRVSLTLDGGAYYERCLHLLEELADTEALFTDGHRPSGRLRVNLPGRPARLVILPRLMAFCERYPDIHLELGINDRLVDLIQEGVDCALRVGELPDSSLVARRLGYFTEISCASPDYLARHGTPVTPKDLSHHQVINYHSGRTGRPLPWEYTEHGQVHECLPDGRLTVDNSEAYIGAALAGFGLVQVPLYTARTHLDDGELVEVLADYRPAPSPVSVVYAHHRHRSSKVRAFVDWLEQTLRDLPGLERHPP